MSVGHSIALLSPSYAPEVRRGTERVIGDIAAALVASGHTPTLITSHPAARVSRSDEDGLKVVRLPRPPEGLLVRRGFQEHLTHLPGSYAALRSAEFDLAHAHYPTDALAALRWRKRARAPVLLSYHGIPQRELAASRRWRLRVISRALNDVDAVTVSSEAAAREMRRWFGIDAHVVYPGVDVETFVPSGERDPDPTILCLGDPDDGRKRIDLVLEAHRRLRERRGGVRLIIVRPRDPARARQLEETRGVEIVDPIDDRATLARAYSRAWVSVLAAHHEAFGLVLAEALACGTPAVGANDGGVPEVISAATGRTFEVDDVRSLIQSLEEVLDMASDPATALECRRRATERFAVERSTARMMGLYDAHLTSASAA